MGWGATGTYSLLADLRLDLNRHRSALSMIKIMIYVRKIICIYM